MYRYNSRIFRFNVERNVNELNDLVVKQIADQTYTNRRHITTACMLFPTKTNNLCVMKIICIVCSYIVCAKTLNLDPLVWRR